MGEWIDVKDRLPVVEVGDEVHCFLARKHKKTGKVFVICAYYSNKPLDGDFDEDEDDLPDWVLRNSDGEPVSMVGWCEKGVHCDFDGYYENLTDEYCETIAWQEIKYPAPPKK